MTNDTLDPAISRQLDAALRNEQPDEAVRGYVHHLLSEGRTRGEVSRLLEGYRSGMSDNRERDDDLLIDIMSLLDGWGSLSAIRKLLPPPCVTPRPWRID